MFNPVTWNRTSSPRTIRDQFCVWGSTLFPRRLREQFCALGSDIISKKTSWSILCLGIVHRNQEDFEINSVPWDRTAFPRRHRDRFCIMEPNLPSKKIKWTLLCNLNSQAIWKITYMNYGLVSKTFTISKFVKGVRFGKDLGFWP